MERPVSNSRRIVRLVRGRWLSALAGVSLAWLAGTNVSFAAAPNTDAAAPAKQPVTKSYLNKQTIQLPILIEDRARSLVQEIHLYIKDQPSAPWTLRDKVGASQTSFTFKAPRDGEYWFTMVTVDNRGQRFPADVTKEEPGLIVVVDTQKPQAEVRNLGDSPDGLLVQCDLRDANLDPVKTKFQYQTADMVYRNLEAAPGRPNTFCIPAQANITGQVRVHAVDMAGNSALVEHDVKNLAASMPVARQAGSVQQTSHADKGSEPAVTKTEPKPQQTSTGPTLTPVEKSAPAKVPQSVVAGPSLEPAAAKMPMAGEIVPTKGTTPAPSHLPDVVEVDPRMTTEPPLSAGSPKEHVTARAKTPEAAPARTVKTPPNPPSTVDVPVVTSAAKKPAMIPAKRDGAPVQRQLVNTAHVALEYQIEQAGASGVGKVEVWITRDRGQSWQKLCEDADRKSPADIDLPGDGLYGVAMVVSNGRGFGASPPAAGDTPDSWVEVDTAKPVAEILGVRNRPEEGPVVHINWTSHDKNLAVDPVELFYAASRQGPWHPIAKNLKAEGQYDWSFPTEAGAQAYIRLVVRDQAGNVAISEMTQPVVLDDMSRPRARIAGVVAPTAPQPAATAPATQQITSPQGN
jgi:hypothetical protein